MRFVFTFIFVLFYQYSSGQGKLLLVGGGTEKQGGWSDTPYQWAINQSTNKKVAILSYQSQDDWLKNYFISLGATQATNYTLSTRTDADLQATYDNLMTCDVIFLKGGDQAQYYSLYKGTKVEQAIEDKFAAGGVIGGTSAGMAILSKVFFSAENGAFYPPDGLENINSPYFSLKDDFLDISSGFIFDTHFVERGRNTRLMAFMAKWFQQTGNLIKGIGVDDQTALCINATKQATCYGTGAIHVYDSQGFTFVNDKINAENITAKVLIHNHQIDLNNLDILQGGNENFLPLISEEDGNYTVMLSGVDSVANNETFIDDFVNNYGTQNDTIIIVTGADTTIASKYRLKMQALGSTNNLILQILPINNDNIQFILRNNIRRSKKVFFINITNYSSFFQFLNGGATGQLLNTHIRRNGLITAFVGDNCKLAGKIYVTNNRVNRYNAYDGNLSFSNGLGLLKTTIVLPNAFNPDDNDFYENNSSAVSYAVAKYKLKYGIYLNKNTWFTHTQGIGKNEWSVKGEYSAWVTINGNTQGGFTNQIASTVSGNPRNIVGFSSMKYALLQDIKLSVGIAKPTRDFNYVLETTPLSIAESILPPDLQISPNPTIDNLHITWVGKSFEVNVYDVLGNLIQKNEASNSFKIQTQNLKKGVYTLLIKHQNQTFVKKILVL